MIIDLNELYRKQISNEGLTCAVAHLMDPSWSIVGKSPFLLARGIEVPARLTTGDAEAKEASERASASAEVVRCIL